MCQYIYLQEDEDSAPQAFVPKKKLDLAIKALQNLRNCQVKFNSPEALNNYVDSTIAEIKGK